MERLKLSLPENSKSKQVLLAIVILFISLIVACLILLIDDDNIYQETKEISGGKRVEISKLANGQSNFDQYMIQGEKEFKKLGQDINLQQKEGAELRDKINKLEKKLEEQHRQSTDMDIDVLALEISKLREENDKIKEMLEENRSVQEFDMEGRAKSRIENITILDNTQNTKSSTFTLENYIPAGSYVKAKVISGVDASVGINSQSEPKPVLFRVIGKAISALYKGKPQKIDIEGCMITGAASGELSSEKVFVRLLKMSCSLAEGEIFETDVQGYVAGIGKTGIRGDVVSREGDFIFKSFLAGVASGAGNAVSQRFTNPIALPSGIATVKSSTDDILGSGVGKGIENSSNSLSNYLIKRAEQYQPVISVPSGIEVELVFNEGVHIENMRGNDD